MVLAHCIAARFRAIESQTTLVRAVVIDRIPVSARLSVPPGSGTVMMSAPHDVMKAQRRHVINQCFM